MYTGKWLRSGLNLALAILLLISCEKQNPLAGPASTGPDTKTTNNLLPPPPPPPFPPPTIRIWLVGPNLPIRNGWGRFSMGSFALSGQGYFVAGGIMDATHVQGTSTDVICFNPATGTWSQKAAFPGYARTGMASFAVNNLGYVCTGVGTNYSTATKETWQYSPIQNFWSRKASLPGPARSYGVGVGLNGMGYVGTGTTNAGGEDGGLTDWWQYNPTTDSWTAKRSMPAIRGRWGAVAFANDQPGGKAYVGTGVDWPFYGPGLGDCNEYDPVADTWTSMPSLPAGTPGRMHAVGMSLADGGVVGTGYNGYNYTDFWEFSFTTKTWSKMADIPGQRFLAQGFTIGRTLYVGGGLYGPGDTPPTAMNDFYSLYW